MYEPKNKRKTLTKRLIKESLLELLKKKEIQKISITELCEEAGINRSTFYSHYGSQYDVLTDIEDSIIYDLHTITNQHVPDKEEDYIHLLEEIILYLKQHTSTLKIILQPNRNDASFASKAYHMVISHDLMKQVFSTEYNDFEKNMSIIYIYNGVYSLIRYWILSDNSMSEKELAVLIFKLAKNGYMDF